MGDRAYAMVTYPRWANILLKERGCGDCSEPLRNLWRYFGPFAEGEYDPFWPSSASEHTMEVEEEEANYGTHAFCEYLNDLGIPYDTMWCDGGDFNEGNEMVRYVDHDHLMTSFADGVDIREDKFNQLVIQFKNNRDEFDAAAIIEDYLERSGDGIPIMSDDEDYLLPEHVSERVADMLVASWEADEEARHAN